MQVKDSFPNITFLVASLTFSGIATKAAPTSSRSKQFAVHNPHQLVPRPVLLIQHDPQNEPSCVFGSTESLWAIESPAAQLHHKGSAQFDPTKVFLQFAEKSSERQRTEYRLNLYYRPKKNYKSGLYISLGLLFLTFLVVFF